MVKNATPSNIHPTKNLTGLDVESHITKDVAIRHCRELSIIMSKKYHHGDHFEIIHKDCGHGIHAKISVVKRESDGELLIWKRPTSNNPEHQKAFRKEIKRSKYWRKFGISKVKVCWHSDKHSLLKTYIRGKTLTQILKDDSQFFSKTNRPVRSLGKLLKLLIDSKHYIQNLICENLVFDGKRWHVIDSSSVHKRDSRSSTRREYKRKFFGSWSKKLHSDSDIRYLQLFLEKYSRSR